MEYADPADYPLMGDWAGEWIGATQGHERVRPQIYAQLLPVKNDHYRVVLLPELYNRAVPYLDIVVPGNHHTLQVNQDGFCVVFEGDTIQGLGNLHGDRLAFTLKKLPPYSSSTLGLKPPEGAIVLFDGSSFDQWHHESGKPVTWDKLDDTMQVVASAHRKNQAEGLGGNIVTKRKYGSMRFHMEFRYPVEANQPTEYRGNSGLFFRGIGEIQILNSYTSHGYWNESGAIYKRIPPKVNAAGPPLAWQTYDVEIQLPQGDGQTAILTVRLNDKIVHNKMEISCSQSKVDILLQDHSNILQFRNIWLKEL
ncbi:MAG: 3-keto-disaccharide hydrolase [Coraliomargaritaceae bacterium]